MKSHRHLRHSCSSASCLGQEPQYEPQSHRSIKWRYLPELVKAFRTAYVLPVLRSRFQLFLQSLAAVELTTQPRLILSNRQSWFPSDSCIARHRNHLSPDTVGSILRVYLVLCPAVRGSVARTERPAKRVPDTPDKEGSHAQHLTGMAHSDASTYIKVSLVQGRHVLETISWFGISTLHAYNFHSHCGRNRIQPNSPRTIAEGPYGRRISSRSGKRLWNMPRK